MPIDRTYNITNVFDISIEWKIFLKTQKFPSLIFQTSTQMFKTFKKILLEVLGILPFFKKTIPGHQPIFINLLTHELIGNWKSSVNLRYLQESDILKSQNLQNHRNKKQITEKAEPEI